MKQETLEEVAEKIYLSYENNDLLYGHSEELQLAYKVGIVDGVKWQQEQNKKCYHPLTERKHTSDTHFECTICGYNNY